MGGFYRGLSDQLSLYVRQLAWLNTAPNPPQGDKTGVKQPKRIVRMKAEGVPIDLPKNPCPYLVDWLMEIGPVASAGMGAAPVGWADIQTWQTLTAIEADPWEARTLMRLSRDFVAQIDRSKIPTCPAPYSTGLTNEQAVTEQFRAMFRFAQRMKTEEGKR